MIGYAKDRIKTDKGLYHAGEDQILRIVQALPDKHDFVMIFGHNPGLTDFANMLLEEKKWIENIPTCGVVAFEFAVQQWSEVSTSNARFLFFDFPKSRED